MSRRRVRYQGRIPGEQRIPRYSSLMSEINQQVTREADREGVSPSFVVAVRLAKSYGITKQEQYADRRKPGKG